MQVTVTTLRVLNVFLEDPREHRYGLALMKTTGLQSGTLYPILARLEKAGWLKSSKEEIDPKAKGRPARRYYYMTPEGVSSARLAKAEIYAHVNAASSSLGGALVPDGRLV